MNIQFYKHECQHSLHRIYIYILKPPSTELEQEFKEFIKQNEIKHLMYFGRSTTFPLREMQFSYSENNESINYDQACLELKKIVYGQLQNVGIFCVQNCIRSCSVLMAFMYTNGYTDNQIKQRLSQSDATDQTIEIMFQKIKPYQEKINEQQRSGSIIQFGYAQASNIQLTAQLSSNQNNLELQSNILFQELNDDSIDANSLIFQPPQMQKVGYRQFNAIPMSNSQFGPPSSNIKQNNQSKILETDKFAESRPISAIPNTFFTPTPVPESHALKLESNVQLLKSGLPLQSIEQGYKLPEPIIFKSFKQGDGFKCMNWLKDKF